MRVLQSKTETALTSHYVKQSEYQAIPQIKIYRIGKPILASLPVQFVSLADSLNVKFSNLLKPYLEWKQNSFTGR